MEQKNYFSNMVLNERELFESFSPFLETSQSPTFEILVSDSDYETSSDEAYKEDAECHPEKLQEGGYDLPPHSSKSEQPVVSRYIKKDAFTTMNFSLIPEEVHSRNGMEDASTSMHGSLTPEQADRVSRNKKRALDNRR